MNPYDFRSPEEKIDDALLELHLDYLCGEDCPYCIEEETEGKGWQK